MVKAIIFDCFGVLVTEAWLPFKKKHFGHDPVLFEQVTEISHKADRGLINGQEAARQTAGLAGITPEEFKNAIDHNVPNEELFVYLGELKQKYKLGFLSNISDDYLHQIFSPDQLAYFDHIELSYKTGVIKPSAKAYENAAEGLGIPVGQCVMVDDQERNITGAKEAGMPGILYQDAAQLKADLQALLKA